MSSSAASTRSHSQSVSPEAIWPTIFCLRVNNFQRMNEIGLFSRNFIQYARFFSCFNCFSQYQRSSKEGQKKHIILNKKCVNQFIEFIYYRLKWLWHNVWQNVCLSFFEEHCFIWLQIFPPTGIFPALTSSLFHTISGFDGSKVEHWSAPPRAAKVQIRDVKYIFPHSLLFL